MLITSSPTSVRPDTVHYRSPAQQQAASEGASRSSAVTLDFSEGAIARAKEAMRLAQERQTGAAEPTVVVAPPRASRPPQKLTVAEALDPEKVHREELKALLTTHTGAQLYVIQKTLDELMGDGGDERSPDAARQEAEMRTRHEVEARARREAMHVVAQAGAAKPDGEPRTVSAPKAEPAPAPVEPPVQLNVASSPPEPRLPSPEPRH